jgi:NADPH-dependent curcumin reductase
MPDQINRQVRLKSRPQNVPQAENSDIVSGVCADPRDGQFQVRNEFLSVDPAMRLWVSEAPSYLPPVAINEVMRSFAAGIVTASRHPGYEVGDRVVGMFGWQDFAVSDGSAVQKVRGADLPLSLYLGALGLNGLTAYVGLLDIGDPKPGETVVVSSAAGGVGSCVGQIAKIKGCRSVGITGGHRKVDLCLGEFKYDAAVDYKITADLDSALKEACPRGIDVYFDNTAGAISDAVLRQLNVGGRVICCGRASLPQLYPPPTGPRVEGHLIVKRASMRGFLITDHRQRFDTAVADLEGWVRGGNLRCREDILVGLEQAPGAIAGLYRGDNVGKRVVRVR